MELPYADYTALKFNRPADGIIEVILSNPGKLNSVTRRGHLEIAEVWRDIDRDPGINVALLRGDNDTFSAGGDFDMIEDMAEDWNYRMRVWKEASDIVYNLINCSKPVVAALQGPCVGAGLAAAMVSDITIAGRSATIVDGHTRLGVAAGDHAAIVWPLLCGMAKAKYYLMLCETMNGEEAERIGLVSKAVDDDQVITEAMRVCEKLNRGATTAIRLTKHSLNNWLRMAGPTFDASVALEMLGFDGPELAEGVRSFREKRRPKFDQEPPW